jgi:hypothetical protein
MREGISSETEMLDTYGEINTDNVFLPLAMRYNNM